jgi:hypothetical protein
VLLINDLVDGLRAASAAMTLLDQIHRATPRLQPTPVGMPHRAAWTAPRPTPLLSCHSFEAAPTGHDGARLPRGSSGGGDGGIVARYRYGERLAHEAPAGAGDAIYSACEDCGAPPTAVY